MGENSAGSNAVQPTSPPIKTLVLQESPNRPPFPVDCALRERLTAVRPIPDDDQCFAWWDDWAMPEHIRRHSFAVAELAQALARAAQSALGRDPSGERVRRVRAAALLHDIAKDHCIRLGGNHAQVGAAVAHGLTGSPSIAHAVMHHVFWPWEIDVDRFFEPLVIIYADKRVLHDRIVTIEERHEDLLDRYGKTEFIRNRIKASGVQVKQAQDALTLLTGLELHAYTVDGGRLVERA